jgi:hypothetical protein
VPDGKRLVLAIEQDAHVDVLHACGGNARCTTCRVEYIAGEPTVTTVAGSGRPDPGPTPASEITPPPVWEPRAT